LDSLTLEPTAPEVAATPEPDTQNAGVVVQESLGARAAEPAPPSAGPAPAGFSCEWCGKSCKSKGALVRHKQACKARPAHIPPPVGRRKRAKMAEAKAAPPPPRPASTNSDEGQPLPKPKRLDEWSAEEGAERAARMVDEVSAEGGSVVDVMARMDAGTVGVPDLIALVCLRALPPPLTDEEYSALRMAYKDREVKLPPWLMTLVVTLAVLGPRVAAHPVAGPWLREQLVGKRKKAKPEPEPMKPPPPPPPKPKPEPQPEPEDKSAKAKAAVKAAMERMK